MLTAIYKMFILHIKCSLFFVPLIFPTQLIMHTKSEGICYEPNYSRGLYLNLLKHLYLCLCTIIPNYFFSILFLNRSYYITEFVSHPISTRDSYINPRAEEWTLILVKEWYGMCSRFWHILLFLLYIWILFSRGNVVQMNCDVI